jgi:hypothetical protein
VTKGRTLQSLKRWWWSRILSGGGESDCANEGRSWARAGCELDGLAKANGAVLAMPREEAAEEHGGDVLGWWPLAEMGGVGPWLQYFGVLEGLHHTDSEPSGKDLAAAHQLVCVMAP